MKTKKQVTAEYPEYRRLINAVINRVSMDSINDINNHGIGGGYGGFIYYSDTCKFFKTYKSDILKMLEEMAESFGQDMLSLVQSFNCLKDHELSQNDIAKAIYQSKGEYVDQVQNALAWFAAEEVCRMFED